MHLLLAALAGLVAGAALRPAVVALAIPAADPAAVTCPGCAPPARGATWCRRAVLPAPGGRCPAWLAEVTTAAAFAAVAAGGATGWYGAAQYWIALLGSALLLIDSAVHRLPDALTLPAAVGTLALLTLAASRGEHGSLPRALAVATAAGALFVLFALGGMGLGDAKLAVSLGALLGWHSWQAAILALVLSYLLGAMVAVVLLIRRRHRKSTLAFGPFLIVGTLAAGLLTGG
ncbi:prepilin peptidase [Streptomyces pinistramenti]|uniref:prepilin peptidase n=1 Tax=Streptomyces pinistramenti TaxID=2884812 RepID=UPI001D074BD2|nr:A24 family peptidase [Streptomyces pinistramenti]MCB5910376.1 A24 family peptidase [Streptomyces pinistramenti]